MTSPLRDDSASHHPVAPVPTPHIRSVTTAPVPRPRPLPILPLQLAEASDERLLAAVRSGNDAAYAELYQRHQPAVRRYARSLVAPHEVDDLTSETFARTLQALRRSKGPIDQPIRYLMVTAKARAVTLWERSRHQDEVRRRINAQDRTSAPSSSTPSIDDGADDLLTQAFADLSPRWRRVLWWNVVEGISPAEIAARTGSTPAAVSALLYRAKKALRAAYEARGGTPPASWVEPNQSTEPAPP